MKKIYLLEELDCANCAMKIEKRVQKVAGVKEVSVDFVSKKMFLEYDDETALDNVIKTITDVEPDVVVKEVTAKKAVHENHDHDHQHNHEEHDSCGCGHEHKHSHEEHDSCGCEHEQKHSHEEHDSCGCGHDHEQSVDRELKGAQRLYIKGLDCASCADKIERYVMNMENVQDASLNFSTGTLFVELKDTSRMEATLSSIIKVVPTLEDGVTIEKEKSMKPEKEHKYAIFSFARNWKLYSGIILFIIGVMFKEESFSMWVFLASYVLAGGTVILTAIKNILRGEVFDENFLMSVATIGALSLGEFAEAVAVMIFYEIGELFQSYAVNRSRKSISSLMDIRADYANVLVDGREEKQNPEQVSIGAMMLVKPGERVPLDGIVVEGTSSLDTSALTGESLPRDVHAEEEILAGVVNLSGVLTIRVTKEYGESTVSRILELVENASSKKAPMEKFITKFARVYTPVVVALAVALAILPPLFMKDVAFTTTLESALTFLVVSCPCALVVSIPLGLFAGVGTASKRGILIKGGNYLEALKDIDTVVFDKTGTLTKGVFKVVDEYAVDSDTNALLEIAAYGEYYSSHPIALSIKEAYGKTIDTSVLAKYEEVAGNGIHVRIDGKDVLLGNHKLMNTYNISYKQPEALGTIVHVAVNQAYAGYLVIDDEIKETSKAAITALKQSGIAKTVMLSGDRKEVGEHVASVLGLDEVHMQLLPADKVEKVEALLQAETEGKKLAFVGDGINDAPVLARADIGVAMGGIGSDAAIEAADIVLMKDDPKALSTAIEIAKKTMTILWQNIVFSLGVKILIMILAVFGIANMWMGVFADVGVTLLAVLNSMRILRMK